MCLGCSEGLSSRRRLQATEGGNPNPEGNHNLLQTSN